MNRKTPKIAEKRLAALSSTAPAVPGIFSGGTVSRKHTDVIQIVISLLLTLTVLLGRHSVLAQSSNSCVIVSPEVTTAVSCGCYFWQGQSYSVSGYYTSTIQTAAGQDSLVRLNLTVLNPDTTFYSASACSSYSWLGSTYTTSGTYYHVYPNLFTGCDSLSVLNLAIAPIPSAPQVTTTQPNCLVTTGSISVDALGAIGFSYSIDGLNYQAGATFSGLAPGTYPVSVRNASGCTSTTVNAVIQPVPTAPAVPNVTITAPACSTMTGTVLVNRPRRADYLYSLNGVTFQASRTFSGIPAGTYTVTVKDSNSCTATSIVQVVDPPAVVVAASAGTISCYGGTAIVSVTATGGTSPYIGTGNFTASAGTSTYTVTDSKGCTGVTAATFNQPVILSANASAGAIACAGGAATVTITASGGTAPYAGVGDFNAFAGTATYTVSDANGCSTIATTTILEPTPLNAAAVASNILCNGGTATIDVSATGGTAPYAGTGSFTVSAGTYDYTVNDVNGCITTTSLTILQPSQMVAVTAAAPIRCTGGTTTVMVTAKGGTAPYTGTGSFVVTQGTYQYTVTDANGCTAISNLTLVDPMLLTATASATPIICNGGTTSVTVSGNGGTAPYTGTGTFVVRTGTYTYAVTDAYGCTATTTITVAQPNALVATSSNTPIACNGGTSNVTIAASGGTAPYSGTGTYVVTAGTYSYTVTDAGGCWTLKTITVSQPNLLNAYATAPGINCFGGTTRVTVTATGGTPGYVGVGTYTVPSGSYSYTVTDTRGCTSTVALTVSEPPQLFVTATATPIFCSGGAATVTIAASGGTSPYNGVGAFTAAAGTYTYTVIDNNGCAATQRLTLTQPTAITGSIVVTNATCTTTGQATVSVSGGTGPYTYLWSNGAAGNVATGLVAGGYTAIVTDAMGCTRNFICTIRQTGTVPMAAGSITGATSVRASSVFNYYIIPVSGATSYQWSLPPLCTGSSTGTSINITFLPGFRSGTICVTPVNACGLGAPSCKLVMAPVISNPGGTKKPDKIPTGIVQAISMNDGDVQPSGPVAESPTVKDSVAGSSEFVNSIAAIQPVDVQNDIRNLIVYPNPSRGRIVIGFKGEKGEKYLMRLLDISGAMITKVDVVGQEDMCQILYDTSILAAGTYQLVVTRADGAVQKSIKVVVQ